MAAKRKTTSEKLDEVLDIATEIVVSGKKPIVVKPEDVKKELQTIESINPNEPESEQDYKKARTGLHRLLVRAERAVDGILDVAEEGGEARHYEVTGQLIRITADIYKDLLSLQKSRAELNKFKLLSGGPEDIPPSITEGEKGGDTFIFQGTTTDLMDAVRASKKKEKEQDK